MLRVALAFAMGVLGIAFAAIFVRLALPAPPIITAFYRISIGTLALVLWLLARRTPLPRGRDLAWALAAGACFGTDHALWNSALVRTSVANATLLVNTTPLYVGLFAFAVLGERPGRRFATAALMALGGTALLVGIDRGSGTAVAGDLLALSAALFYSAYLLLMKAVRRGADVIPSLAVMGVGATGVLCAYALALELPFRGHSLSSWTAFVGAALVSQLGGVVGIVWALRYLKATFASVALLAQPVGTALLGWLLLDEGLSWLQGLGGLAVLAGIFLASREARDPAHASGGRGDRGDSGRASIPDRERGSPRC